MRFGDLRGGVMFVTAFAAMFASLSVGAPAAKAQVGLRARMTVMHQNTQLHFSIVDPTLPPTQDAAVVGKFVSATSQSSRLVEGHTFPSHINPDYLYGFTFDGQDVRRVGQTGVPIDSTNFGNMFSRITGAWLVQKNVPTSPQSIPRSYDLKEHIVLTGQVEQGNPSLTGNTTGMMLLNPKTMSAYKVGQLNMFLGQSASVMFEDVCFGVYPGPDGDYEQTTDNEYRYVIFYSIQGTQQLGLYCLSLTEHETMTGNNPPNPWDPVEEERGPDFTHALPNIAANSKVDSVLISGEDNMQQYCRSWYARPEMAPPTGTFGLATDVTYFMSGWVALIANPPPTYAPWIRGWSLGNLDPMVALTGAVPLIGPVYVNITDIFKAMVVVGDWALCSTGDGVNGDGFADQVWAVNIPEFLDGPGDGDFGISGGITSGLGSIGYGGYMPNLAGNAYITYVGTGGGQSIMLGTTRDPFQNWPAALYDRGLLTAPLAPIDMHTQEERMLGLNVRQAPQPFAGFWFSEDPADTFPGFRDGGGKGSSAGGCGGSTEGGMGASVGLLALMGMTFLVVQVLREARKT